MKSDSTKFPPFETNDLRKNLTKFLDTEFHGMKVGNYRWGAYAFYDYDGEPIYVGQTNEMLRTRIRRHLTNQRTDAVAMSVLDPLEVLSVEVWPLPDLQEIKKPSNNAPERAREEFKAALASLNSLELSVFQKAIKNSHFNAVLNEKDPAKGIKPSKLPASIRKDVVSEDVVKIRSHPDVRLARRAATLARLAQVISERQVSKGLRRTLVTQARRLQWLAERRFESVAGHPDETTEETEEI
jgi:hypothetical protein